MATPRKALSLFPGESGTDSATVRPPLKWAGGKRWQVSELYPYWKKESHRRLVEPFCGGLAVTLGLMPPKALLNDMTFAAPVVGNIKFFIPLEPANF
jgi:hypothetical protein